jgi:hypothetical protein
MPRGRGMGDEILLYGCGCRMAQESDGQGKKGHTSNTTWCSSKDLAGRILLLDSGISSH